MKKLNRQALVKLLSSHLFISGVVFTIIFVNGFWLRAMRPDYYPLGFDQIQILQNASLIQQHHLVLIGPRTGPAPMFTGPLIYYVAGGLLKFTPAPQVLVSTALTLFILTFVCLVWLVRRYLDDTWVARLFIALYTFSPFQITLDRVPWNPDLTVLAAALVFFPLFGRLGKKLKIIDLVTIMTGCFLGYQAHFSGLLLPIFVGVAWFGWYRRQWWLPILAGVGTLASLVPTALFDYRHQFINWHGLLEFLKERGTTNDPAPSLPGGLFNNVLITLENVGKILAVTSPYYVLLPIGLGVLILFVCTHRRFKSQFRLTLLWMGLLDVIFVFYKGTKPEYYFLLQFPALYYVIARVFRQFIKQPWQGALLIVILMSGSIFSINTQLQHNPPALAIGNQVAAATQVRQYQTTSHSIIVYDMKGLDAQAMQYLLADLPSGAATTSTQTTHLIYPFNHDSPSSNSFGQLAVWQDPRTNPQRNYLVRKQTILVTPLNMELLENHYPQQQLTAADTRFELIQNSNKIGELYVIDDKQNDAVYNDFMKAFMKMYDRGRMKWQPVKLNGQSGFVYPAKDVTFILFFSDQQMLLEEQANLVNKLEVL